MASTSSSVAIIGGGQSGLVAAKYILEEGLVPTIFEKSSTIGGLWSSPSWRKLRTNISRFTTCFSDFAWSDGSSMFPTQDEMRRYLEEYCSHFIPDKYIQLNAEVMSLVQNEDKTWTVKFVENGEVQDLKVKIFDHAIIATGFFSKAYLPPVQIDSDFKGTIIHSGDYREPEKFKGQRVVVAGASFSSAEISSELSIHAKSVINVVPKPFWPIPRYIPLETDIPATKFLPFDLAFYNRKVRDSFKEKVFKTGEDFDKNHKYFNQIYGPEGSTGNFKRPAVSGEPDFVAVSDNYLTRVRSGRIQVEYGRVKAIEASSILLDNESLLENVDSIVFCSGFRPALPFLSQEILDAIEFDPNDSFNPIILYKSMMHPKFSNLAFIGMYRGPFFLVLELQALLAAKIFSGSLPRVHESIQYEGIAIEKQIKNQIPRPQFPHIDYIGFAYSLAEILGNVPSEEWAETHPIVTPFDFQPESNEAAMKMLKSLEIECEMFRNGKMVAGSVFRSLEGIWAFQRTVKNNLEKSPVYLDGTRTFRMQPCLSSSRFDTEYEDTEVVTTKGFSKDISSKYIWRYDLKDDILSVSYNEDAKGARKLVTNKLQFLFPDSSTLEQPLPAEFQSMSGWKAIIEYTFQGSIVKSFYVFKFNGLHLSQFDVLSNVVGHGQNTLISTAYFPSQLSSKSVSQAPHLVE